MLESSLISSLSTEYNRAGRIRDEAMWYLSRDMTALSGKREPGSFGPFTSRVPVEWFFSLLSSGKGVFPEIPEDLFASVFDEWMENIRRRGTLALGRELKSRERPETDNIEVIDQEYVLKRLGGSLESAALQIRRAAALNLLHGGTVRWGTDLSFLDDLAEGGMTQSKLWMLSVLLGELKRVYREGKEPELVTRWGSVL